MINKKLKTKKKNSTMIYVRKATKSRDGEKGFLFLNLYDGGHEYVILEKMADVSKYI